MYEEVPRVRRGLGRLTAARVVLGPFVIGGGMLLATVGGSVAVAATVITASTIVTSDAPARHAELPTAPAAPGHQASSTPAAGRLPGLIAGPVIAPISQPPGQPRPSSPVPGPDATVASSALSNPARSAAPAPSSSSPSSTGSPAPTSAGPAGNALIYITGFDQATNRVLYQFAEVQHGAGPGGSDLYLVSAPDHYSAGLASGLSIISGGQLCPPAGSSCTIAQLIAAASDGFFADAAIDPAAQLEAVTEVDNAGGTAQANPSGSSGLAAPAPSASPSPSPTAVG